MEYIATAALVSIALCLLAITWDVASLTRAFIEFMETPRTNLNTHVIPQELIDLLSNFRRRKPVVKKETV